VHYVWLLDWFNSQCNKIVAHNSVGSDIAICRGPMFKLWTSHLFTSRGEILVLRLFDKKYHVHVTPLECIGNLSFFCHMIILDYTLTYEVSCWLSHVVMHVRCHICHAQTPFPCLSWLAWYEKKIYELLKYPLCFLASRS
jgi:hypothetical protein